MKVDISQYNSKKPSNESNKIVITEDNTKISSKKNYINNLFSNKMKIIFSICYFLIVIWSETIYREYLFEKSITFQESIQKEEKNRIILKICKILSIFGAEIYTLFLVGIIFLFMPLNYSFIILQVIVYSSYFTNTLKMIYQSDRPNWRSKILTFSCNYGYGNPSGHSFTSISLYLCLSHILVQYFNVTKIIKIVIFTFFIIFSILIALSRVILAAHSFNQIIYGFLLGLGLYFVLIHIIQYHKYTSIEFLLHIRKKIINIIYNIFHIFLLIFTILVYFLTKSKDHSDIEESIFNGVRCKIKNPISKYKNDGLFQSLSITSIIGAQFGINFLIMILKFKNYLINSSIIEWNKTKIKKLFQRIPVVLLSSIGIILYYIIPKDIPLIFIFIFKSGLPFFLGMFGIHFFGILFCINLKFANTEIYKMDALHDITSGV